MNHHNVTTVDDVSEEMVQSYRTAGFVHVPGILSKNEVEAYHRAALSASRRLKTLGESQIFDQYVNVWCHDEAMKGLTLHPTIAAVAERLAGVPLRLWHDQILIKQPKSSRPTEFHQDQPFWPHASARQPISAWVALVDVPVERGCMTFIPGSHSRTDLPAQSTGDSAKLFELAPDLIWAPRVTIPLKAGDCTFHHGRCAHMATPNVTDELRVAHVIIYTDAETTYTGQRHVVTDPLGLPTGERLEGALFPAVRDFGSVRG